MDTAPVCDFGWKAPDFTLPATDGRTYSLQDVSGPKGTLVMFICNHCPYVTGAIDRIVADVGELMKLGIGAAAICANDARQYPEDGFDRMVAFARSNGFPFPYLHDETQQVARAYDAECTPEFFGFDREFGLQYHGRLDEGGRKAVTGARRELYEAMSQVVETGRGPAAQTATFGCSIKWKPTR